MKPCKCCLYKLKSKIKRYIEVCDAEIDDSALTLDAFSAHINLVYRTQKLTYEMLLKDIDKLMENA